jgi:hypothetical protein
VLEDGGIGGKACETMGTGDVQLDLLEHVLRFGPLPLQGVDECFEECGLIPGRDGQAVSSDPGAGRTASGGLRTDSR